jgi:Domain of unknown function (DUF397)
VARPAGQRVLTVDLEWRKSSYSNSQGTCVELARQPDGMIAVRNSRDQDGPVLEFTRAEMSTFAIGLRTGQFDDLLNP